MKPDIARQGLRWNPGWKMSLFAGFFLPVFVSLGFWQLNRAEEKEVILEAFAQLRAIPRVDAALALESPNPNYRQVDLVGHTRPDRLILLDNRVRDGKPGIEVLLPVQTLNQTWLVNLGFLPKPRDMSLPQLPLIPATQVSVQGYLYAPDKPRVVLKETDTQQFPWLLQRLDFDRIQGVFERPAVPWQVRIDRTHPLALQTDWPLAIGGPEKHQGYAFQWFAMAFTLAGLTFYTGIRRGRHGTRT